MDSYMLKEQDGSKMHFKQFVPGLKGKVQTGRDSTGLKGNVETGRDSIRL